MTSRDRARVDRVHGRKDAAHTELDHVAKPTRRADQDNAEMLPREWRMIEWAHRYGQTRYGLSHVLRFRTGTLSTGLYSNTASKISMSTKGGFAINAPSAPIFSSRHRVGTMIPEKRWCPENTCAICVWLSCSAG